ncbi:flagellar biosynthetic protein FliR [Bacillus massilinigeriensis]|uniref:flagellar biosynthetic protein FliR n=1 Tax=Bacillus mediterraneensis TaxID=1805474 RepID=UPI0008F8CA2F|nr:flagellar biosynthetic protein FliR [Bacillus mediterraneensis]
MIGLEQYLPGFLLIFTRVTAFFLMLPLFSYRTIPAQHKIGLSFFLAILMYSTIKPPVLEMDGLFFLLAIKEVLVGLAIGFAAAMILSAVQIAGGLIDFQMGFAIANVIDPQSGTQSPLTGQYLYMIALLFLLSVNGHHMLLNGIFHSYELIPIDQASFSVGDAKVAEQLIKSFNAMFVTAVQMSIPVVGSLFLVDVALGIVARTVPQLNVFVVGMPIKTGVSFIVLIAVMGAMMVVVTRLFGEMFATMKTLMELIGGA